MKNNIWKIRNYSFILHRYSFTNITKKYQIMIRIVLFFQFALLLFLNSLSAQTQHDTTDFVKDVFDLGQIVISASNHKNYIQSTDFQKFNTADVSTALSVLPSLTFVNVGGRNESMVYVRGFDLRRVPVFADGIPIYVPYDGYVDLARFITSDLSKIEVSKGYTSILYGANTMGGAINLIGTKPTDRFKLSVRGGMYRGKGYTSDVSVGSRFSKFYIQANASRLQHEHVPLSADFDTVTMQTNHELHNSYRKDDKLSLKLGFVPNRRSEYALSYIYQHGDKGNPVYLGEDETVKLRFWQWPRWDKQSVYFISKTGLGEKSYVKTRLFYDNFVNVLKGFDNETYSTQEKRSSFTSYYDDYSCGASVEAGTELIPKNLLKIAVHYKNDMHRENNEGEPMRHVSDYTVSFGAEDEISVTDRLKVIPGVSYNSRASIIAEEYDSKNDLISQLPANANNAVNAQIATQLKLTDAADLFLTIARKSRFATMKDRYSYRLGIALPNPDLQSEFALNSDISMPIRFSKNITFEPSVFYSRIQNTIQIVDDVQPGIYQLQNTGESEFYGAEATLSYKLIEQVHLSANYSFIEQKNLTNPDIKFTDVPKHKFFAYIDILPAKHLIINISTTYYSQRFSTSNDITSQEFMLVNSQISYNFARYFGITAGINNLLDKNYAFSEGYPNAGRVFNLSVNFNFLKK